MQWSRGGAWGGHGSHLLGIKKKKSQKEEKLAGQTKQNQALPLALGLDPPLVCMQGVQNFAGPFFPVPEVALHREGVDKNSNVQKEKLLLWVNGTYTAANSHFELMPLMPVNQ